MTELRTLFARKHLPYLLLLAAALALAFSPSLSGPYLNWDDGAHVFLNPHVYILSPASVWQTFTSLVNGTYIPLTTLSFAVENALYGLSPAGHHALNIALHMGTCILLAALVMRLGLSFPAALLTAFIFGLHPVHVESVAWITERKDVLYSIFYVGALYRYAGYVHSHRRADYLWALGLAFLSILAKPMALSLPWILWIVDLALRRPVSRRMLLDKIPFFVLLMPVALVTYLQFARVPPMAFPQSVMIWLWSVGFYLEKFFMPAGLAPLYAPPDPLAWSNPVIIKSATLVIVFMASLILFRRNRIWLLAGLFFAGSSFFLWRFDLSDLNLVADRFLYLPSAGFCAAVAAGLVAISQRACWRVPAVGVTLGLLTILGTLTFQQSRIWQSDLALWERVLQLQPANTRARHKRLEILNRPSATDGLAAIKDLTAQIARKPQEAERYNQRGKAILQLGQPEAAFRDFDAALALNPELADAYNNRGGLYLMREDYAQALADFEKAVSLDPLHAVAHLNRGKVFAHTGDADASLKAYTRALQINPELVQAYERRGTLFTAAGHADRALQDFDAALKLNPNLVSGYLNRAKTHIRAGNVRQAVADYMQVLEREPNNPEHYKDLGIILQKAGRVKDALSYYDKGLALDPYDPALYNNRGLIRAGQSDLDGALSDFTQAIRLNPKQYRYYVTRGDLRQLQEDTAGALRDYATALRYMPVSAPDPAPHIRRAQIFTAQDKKDAALAEWQAALRIAPDNTEIQSALSALTATDISR